MSTNVHTAAAAPTRERATTSLLDRPVVRYAAGVAALAIVYFAAAKVGQSLRYTASVAAIWPPAGVGIAALYLWGTRFWPGVFLAETVINAELYLGPHSIPLGSIVGQQIGNMAEVIVGALLLRRLIGERSALDRVEHVGWLLVAIGTATAISATCGTISMLLGGVIPASETATFWRTWWLGDTSGALVVVPLALSWAHDPRGALRRVRSRSGLTVIAVVIALTIVVATSSSPMLYLVFPGLVWAALRLGLPGATLSVAIVTAITIGITAHRAGPFSSQPIDERTLGTQLYVFVAVVTTLFLGAIVSERERTLRALAASRKREDGAALEERHRIGRDLHDSVSQALFSTVLHTRTAQRALDRPDGNGTEPARQALRQIGDLMRGAQSEMRSLIFELGRDETPDGLVEALVKQRGGLTDDGALAVAIEAPSTRLPLEPSVETQLFHIAREALANVVKHAAATNAWIRIEARPDAVVVEVSDDGLGFDTTIRRAGHFGLESMRSRAAEVGGDLTITSTVGNGTVVRVEVPMSGGSNGR